MARTAKSHPAPGSLGAALLVSAVALAACGVPGATAPTVTTTAPLPVSTAPPLEPPSTEPTTPVAPTTSPSPEASGASALAYPPPADGAPVMDYLPGFPAQVRLPVATGPAPLVVLIPGGGWATSDPNMLAPLAGLLTRDGATTSVITYATSTTGGGFPVAVDQVACAVRWSAQQATDMGHPPTRVIVLGHSAGGQLASLVAFSGDEFGADCPSPPVQIDGLVGIAGIYNTDWFESGMTPWMGVSASDDPDRWRRANPLAWLQDGSRVPEGLRVLLIHGDLDENVPVVQATTIADALRAAGLEVSATIFPGLGHLEVAEAGIADPPIQTWLDAWPDS